MPDSQKYKPTFQIPQHHPSFPTDIHASNQGNNFINLNKQAQDQNSLNKSVQNLHPSEQQQAHLLFQGNQYKTEMHKPGEELQKSQSNEFIGKNEIRENIKQDNILPSHIMGQNPTNNA